MHVTSGYLSARSSCRWWKSSIWKEWKSVGCGGCEAAHITRWEITLIILLPWVCLPFVCLLNKHWTVWTGLTLPALTSSPDSILFHAGGTWPQSSWRQRSRAWRMLKWEGRELEVPGQRVCLLTAISPETTRPLLWKSLYTRIDDLQPRLCN